MLSPSGYQGEAEMSLLYVKNAEKRIAEYVGCSQYDSVVEASRLAVDCMDCEAFLDCGIRTFEFVMHVDERIREAIITEKIAYDEDVDQAILQLIKAWLGTVPDAMRWIERCERGHYTVANRGEFMKCIAEAEAIAKYDPSQPMPHALEVMRDQALIEQRNGHTLESFSGTE